MLPSEYGAMATVLAPPPPPPVLELVSVEALPPAPLWFAPPVLPEAALPGKMLSDVLAGMPVRVASYSPPGPPEPPPVTNVLTELAPDPPSAMTVRWVTPVGTGQVIAPPVALKTQLTCGNPVQVGLGPALATPDTRPEAGNAAPVAAATARIAIRDLRPLRPRRICMLHSPIRMVPKKGRHSPWHCP